MRDIVFLSIGDWANVGASLAAAGREVGMDCVSFDYKHHPFGYLTKSSLLDEIDPGFAKRGRGDLRKFTDDFKAVVLMHSRSPAFFGFKKEDIIEKRSWQKWAAFHGTTPFRESLLGFNEIVDVQLFQTADLSEHGMVNEQWLIPPVDTEYIKPVFSESEIIKGKGLVFRHNPRHEICKGSSVVNKVMENFKSRCNYEFSSEQKLWPENIERMGQCDAYIVSMGETNIGEGEWGLTALEAAALGKIVITQFGGLSKYEKEYNCVCPFVVVENSRLDIAIEKVLTISPGEIVDRQKQTRKWVEDVHSYKPTGLRLKKFLIRDK